MGTPIQQIEAHIEQTGEALGSNLDELKQKVKAATDWRRYFRANPKVLPGIAFGGDLVFGPRQSGDNLKGRNDRRSKRHAF